MMALTFTLAFFLLQGHQGFDLADEGSLWYGAQRVMVGEVPIRDFMSYDIGRYYWSATFMTLFGNNGIVALRLASAIFQTIAIYIGLAILARSSAKQNNLFLSFAAITLVVWMPLQFRLFDTSLPIMLVGALSFLIEQPSRRRYFLAGMAVGLVAVFGRNHGVYGLIGSLGVMIYLDIRRESGPGLKTAFTAWTSGVVAGYLPVLVFIALVPGFAQSFWQTFPYLFGTNPTPLLLPFPWPWKVSSGQMSITTILRSVITGTLFIAIAVFGVMGIVWAIRKRLQNKPVSPALIASVFLSLPYVHYAYSRAELEHLTIGIAPFLLGIFALLDSQPAKIKLPSAALLCCMSLFVVIPKLSFWYCYSNPQCVEIRIAGDKIKVDGGTASNLETLNELAEQFAPGDRAFIAAPFWPGAYAALQRKSPMWEIYALFPRSIAFQQAEIERIKAANPGFVVIDDRLLDRREDTRFRNTHPLIYQYIRDNFELLDDPMQPPQFQIYRSKGGGQ